MPPRRRARLGWAGSGIHPAMLRAHARAFVLSVIPGTRRRNSIAAGSRQLSLLIEGGADRGGIGLGDDEHPKSMSVHTAAGKPSALTEWEEQGGAPSAGLGKICYQE